MGTALLCLGSCLPLSSTLSGVAYEPPPRETVGVFLDELHVRVIVAHFRRPRGATIDGACGHFPAQSPLADEARVVSTKDAHARTNESVFAALLKV